MLISDSAIRRVALELEGHAELNGWDQPAKLYALVSSAELSAIEPELAQQLGLDPDGDPAAFTSIEQESLPLDQSLEESLIHLVWPEQVQGCAAVLERLMLPPAAESDMPDDPAAVEAYVAAHPDRYEVRIVAAVSRDGSQHSIVRLRDRPDDQLLEGPDLVPTLTTLLTQTLSE
ncbi:MAG: hypothetical protein JWP10_292 [Nocardioidaceae bacterium]|nr:hypothetical protein [Nocardioidaceae bacterium]